jgi:hypothetical protein
MVLVGVSLLLMSRVAAGSSWTVLLPGFLVGGIAIGLVNAPLAATAVSVVEPRQAGVASGINNTMRQVGLATGIAALGAIFQSRISGHLGHAPSGAVRAVASGHFPKVPGSPHFQELARSSFVNGLHDILLVASCVAFAGAVLAFALVRRRDFVGMHRQEAEGAVA